MNTTPEQIADLTKAHTSAHQDLLSFVSSVQTRMNQLETELQQTKNDLKSQFLVAAPVGSIIVHAAQTPPNGWFECDGEQKSRTDFATLFNSISISYGEGDGSSTFNLPDLRGEFVRGWDHNREIDGGRGFGAWQEDALQNLTGEIRCTYAVLRSGGTGVFLDSLPSSRGGVRRSSPVYDTAASDDVIKFDASDSPSARTSAETRPRNLALMYCIKY